jgi:hypothetical protein
MSQNRNVKVYQSKNATKSQGRFRKKNAEMSQEGLPFRNVRMFPDRSVSRFPNRWPSKLPRKSAKRFQGRSVGKFSEK